MVSASSFGMPSLTVRGRALDEVLGFLQAEARDLADDLDDADLVRAEARRPTLNSVCSSTGAAAAAAAAPAPAATATGAAAVTPNLSSINFDELDDFHDGHVGDARREFFLGQSHDCILLKCVSLIPFDREVRCAAACSGPRPRRSCARASRAGSASVRTNLLIGALINPSSCAAPAPGSAGDATTLDVAGRQHRPAERHQRRTELVVVLRKALDDSCGSARIVLREREHQRTLQAGAFTHSN